MVVMFGWVLVGIFAFIGFCVTAFQVGLGIEFRKHRKFAIWEAKTHLDIELDLYRESREELSSRVSSAVLADFDSRVEATKEKSEALIREMAGLRNYLDGYDTDRNLPMVQIAAGENTQKIFDLCTALRKAAEEEPAKAE